LLVAQHYDKNNKTIQRNLIDLRRIAVNLNVSLPQKPPESRVNVPSPRKTIKPTPSPQRRVSQPRSANILLALVTFFTLVAVGIVAMVIIIGLMEKPEITVTQVDITETLTPTILPTSTSMPSPIPTATQTSVSSSLPNNCTLWSNIDLEDAGREMCVYGELLSWWFGSDTYESVAIFSQEEGAFILVDRINTYPEFGKGSCIWADGEIQIMQDVRPYIELKGKLNKCEGDIASIANEQLSSILLSDDFSDSGSGWDIYDEPGIGSTGYTQGEYFIIAEDPDNFIFGVYPIDIFDVEIEVTIRQVSGPSNNNTFYGVTCRLQPNYDRYEFNITGDGYYLIGREVGDERVALAIGSRPGAIKKAPATNILRAVCQGDELALYVNEELLAVSHDSTLTSGSIALHGRTFEDTNAEFRFDNIVVRQP